MKEIGIGYIKLKRIFFIEFFWLCKFSDKKLTIFHFTKYVSFFGSKLYALLLDILGYGGFISLLWE